MTGINMSHKKGNRENKMCPRILHILETHIHRLKQDIYSIITVVFKFQKHDEITTILESLITDEIPVHNLSYFPRKEIMPFLMPPPTGYVEKNSLLGLLDKEEQR